MKYNFVKKGWYRVTMHSGKGHRTFVGQFASGGPTKFLKGEHSYVFEIGNDETVKGIGESRVYTSGPVIMWLAEGDIISVKRLSPRYIETKITKRGSKTIERYDSPDILYGESEGEK